MISLYTAPTPNGYKVSIALEELGLPYRVESVSLRDGQQKEPAFLAMNPNGRIPVIIDHDEDDLVVFESGAILVYLSEKAGRLRGESPRARSEVLQWLMFQVSGIGPMMGQANVFSRYAPETIPYAIDRYRREGRRLFEVLERRLEGRPFLVDEYSIADIACFPWVRTHEWSGIEVEGLPRVLDWLQRVRSRPAVERGLSIPERRRRGNSDEERELVRDGSSLLV